MTRFVKNFTLGIGLMTALAFVSCDRGDEADKIPVERAILNTWYKGVMKIEYGGKNLIETETPGGCEVYSYIAFHDDGFLRESLMYANTDGECIENLKKYQYTILGNNKILINYDGFQIEETIIKLEGKELILQHRTDIDEDGIVDIVTNTYYGK